MPRRFKKPDTPHIFAKRKKGTVFNTELNQTKINEVIMALKGLKITDPKSFNRFIQIYNAIRASDNIQDTAQMCGWATSRTLQRYLEHHCFNIPYIILATDFHLKQAIEFEFVIELGQIPVSLPWLPPASTFFFPEKREGSDSELEEPPAKRQKIDIPIPVKASANQLFFHSAQQQDDNNKVIGNANSAFNNF
jgi:hypothetical protein